MPARMGEKFPGVSSALVHRVLATHLDVAPEGNRADAVIGFSAAHAQQALTKADGEYLDPYSKQFCGGVMTPFVNQDHESENHRDRNHSNNKFRHRSEYQFLRRLQPAVLPTQPAVLSSHAPCGGPPNPLPALYE